MTEDLRIIFMGTPDFAVPSLQILVENGFQVVAVVTAPDKPAGRGLKLAQSPVKEYALSRNIPLLQPANLKGEAFLEELRSYQANLQVVVAFRMLPEAVWSMPAKGTFNIHASLLPQYRGAAPINWALIHGETVTGVTSFFLQQQIDTGDIILQDQVAISEQDNFGTLYEKLKHAGAALALKTVRAIAAGTVATQPQPQSGELRPAPKIFKETCQINWHQPARQVRNFIRGLSPYPTAWTLLEGKVLKVFAAERTQEPATALAPGSYRTDHKTYLHFGTAAGSLSLTDLQLEGKKRMTIEEFLRGYRFGN
jgi:methionyl-tRNA formyltransferase